MIFDCDSDKDTADFVDTIYASSPYTTINTPTRITATSKTLIDNILHNNFTEKITAGNIATSIYDHLTQFLTIRDQITNSDNNRKKEVPKIRKFDKENFLADLKQIDWNNYLKIYKNDTDLSSELFLRKINFLYNKHRRLITSKRKNKQDPLKPWLTPIIIKSIRTKNNLHKQFCQATNSAQRLKTLIYTKTSKNVSQKLTLNVDNKTISDDHIIANHFNSFFTSIAGELLKIPKAKKSFDSFLTKSNAKTFFLSPVTPEEVLNELKTFNLNKVSGPNSIPVKILKDMKSEISVPLSTLIN